MQGQSFFLVFILVFKDVASNVNIALGKGNLKSGLADSCLGNTSFFKGCDPFSNVGK